MPLLVDLDAVPDWCCNVGLEDMVKAMSAGDPAHLWDKMPNPWLRAHVEAVTARLGGLLDRMRAALGAFLHGEAGALHKADVPWLRWDEARFQQVRNRLESLDPSAMTADDYLLLIEWLVNRYLPAGVIETEADFLAVRAVLLGKIQANLEVDHRVTERLIDSLASLLPTDFAAVPPRILTPMELAVLSYGRAHAAEAIRSVTSQARHRMAVLCMEHVQAGLLGQKEGRWQALERRLFDEFSVLNRDFRRIAVTEAGEAINQGYVAALEPGRHVKRIEAYRGACDFCKSINGRVFEVVAPDAPDKDGSTQVWPGKSNVGRSASPRKREGNFLVEREPSEMWWPAAGVQHPNCRGSWLPVTDRPAEVSQEFFDWMQAQLDAVDRS